MQTIISKDMTDALMRWFKKHRRTMPWRGSENPYHIWVSEMMLQQTQVATVGAYYERWIERFPTVGSLADAELEDVLKVWEGLGYYTRARNFHKGANYIVAHAKDKKAPFPETYDEWLKVPGVGPYTAAAVSSIAFHYPAAVVDGNVKRVMARLFCFDEPVNTQTYHKKLSGIMNKGFYDHDPGWVNQAWMELGSLQCTPRPDCSTCPLAAHCCALNKNIVSAFPRKSVKRKLPTRYGAAFIIKDEDKVLMLKRPDKGFLGGLWEYPGFTLKETAPDYTAAFCRQHRLRIVREHSGSVRHSYSHFHQELTIYEAVLDETWQFGEWTDARMVTRDEQNQLPRSKVAIKIGHRIDTETPGVSKTNLQKINCLENS